MPLEGVEAIVARLQVIASQAVSQEGGRALFEEGEAIKRVGVPRTPLKVGTLRGSWQVHAPEAKPDGAEVRITVGGAAKDYALAVHERMGPTNWSEPGTGPKYLEGPTMEAANGMAARLAQRISLERLK